MTPCLICGTSGLTEHPNLGDYLSYSCPRCGEVSLSGTVVAVLDNRLGDSAIKRAKLAHFFRRRNAKDGLARPVSTHQLDAILAHPLPRPREQADLLIRLLAERGDESFGPLHLSFERQGYAIGSATVEAFSMIVDHLFSKQFLAGEIKRFLGSNEPFSLLGLTFSGWERYEQLRTSTLVYRRAFVAMKFGDETLNGDLDSTLRPAVQRAGFELRKLDDEPKAGLIDNRLRAEIQASDFVIADLSHDNLGAYWEAGYAEGLGKPVIYTCEKAKFTEAKTHFDTNHHTTIIWDTGNLGETARQLTATIRATLPHVARMMDDN